MKIDAKRKHILLKLTKAEVEALGKILGPAEWDKEKNPVTWLTKSKVIRRVLCELRGVVDGVEDPYFEEDELDGGNPYDDADVQLSEAYRAARREGALLGTPGTRR